MYRHTIRQRTYTFPDLRTLLARASPPRSGDQLAGVAADTYEERVAAQYALADVPLKQFLQEALVPYEQDEVTRLILDTHDAAAFTPISHFTVGGAARLAAVGSGGYGHAPAPRPRFHTRNGGCRE